MKAFLLALALLFSAAPGLARESILQEGGGNSVGVGGHSVACWSGGRLNTLEALDLYEGRMRFNYNYELQRNNQGSDPVAIALIYARKIDYALGVRNSAGVENKLGDVVRNVRLNPGDLPLRQTYDSKFVVTDPNCRLVQTFNFNRHIDLSEGLWSRHSAIDKAALYLHEALYWHLREIGRELDSRRVRKVVSYLFAGGDLMPVAPFIPRNSSLIQLCESTGKSSRDGTSFTAYQDEEGYLNLAFHQIGGMRMMNRTQIRSPEKMRPESAGIQPSSGGGQAIRRTFYASQADSLFDVTVIWGRGTVEVIGSFAGEQPIHDYLTCRPAKPLK